MEFERLAAGELPTSTVALARALIGVVLVRRHREGLVAGRIVETEAYPLRDPLRDPASHAFGGKRPRNAAMFLAPFHSYVYLIYGRSLCFNISSEAAERGAAVLIRALEPLAGIDLMRQRRVGASDRDLCRGPGRLTTALDIDRTVDGRYLPGNADLWLGRPDRRRRPIGTSCRIGISLAADRRLRFYERGNPYVSGPRHLSP